MERDNHAATRETREQCCPACGWKWEVAGLLEYGKWAPFNDEDMICPDCWKELTEE